MLSLRISDEIDNNMQILGAMDSICCILVQRKGNIVPFRYETGIAFLLMLTVGLN